MKSKVVLVVLLIVILVSTGTVLAGPKPIVRADNTYYDINTGIYMLKGNCYLEIRDRIITCDEAKVSVSSLEVWGSGGIRLTQGDITFTGGSAYIAGMQDLARIEGGVAFARPGMTVVADRAEFNWRNKTGVFSGNVRVNRNGTEWTTDTLSYNVETNTIL